MLQRTVPAVVDTRIWDGTRDPELIKWMGEDTHRFDGTQLVLQTPDGDVYPGPGWTLLRWPDGDLTVMSSRAAAKRLTPTAAPSRVQEEWIAKYGNRPTGTAHDVEVLHPPHDEIETAELRDQIAAAIYERNNPGHPWTDAHPDDRLAYGFDADAALTVILPAARITATLGRMSEAHVQRVLALYERWVKVGPPPLGASVSRWWDRRLAELHRALLSAKERDGTETGTEA